MHTYSVFLIQNTATPDFKDTYQFKFLFNMKFKLQILPSGSRTGLDNGETESTSAATNGTCRPSVEESLKMGILIIKQRLPDILNVDLIL